MTRSGRIINQAMLAVAVILFIAASAVIILNKDKPVAPPPPPPADPGKTPAITVVNTGDFGFKGIKVVIEAEKHEGIEAPVEVAASSTASGGSCIQILDKAGKEKGRAIVPFSIPADGVYRLWGRRWWKDGCGNSMTFRIQGKPAPTFTSTVNPEPRPADEDHLFGDDATYNPGLQEPWLWTEGHLYTFRKGQYTLIIKNREDGVKLDQILLAQDIKSAFGYDYTPTGIETGQIPAASPKP